MCKSRMQEHLLGITMWNKFNMYRWDYFEIKIIVRNFPTHNIS